MSALVRAAMARAIATGAMMSAPLAVTPCGSSVPSGTSTVSIRLGTTSRNSIQLMRSSSRVVGACAAAAPGIIRHASVAQVSRSLMVALRDGGSVACYCSFLTQGSGLKAQASAR